MKTPLHLLNGDHLAHQLHGASYFQTHLVFREALIVGPVTGTCLDEFWKLRTEFITTSYGVTAEEYSQKTISEIEQLHSITEDTEICIWFEDDLFCQVNLWFILNLISDSPRIKIFRVFPPETIPENRWKGFGGASTAALEQAYEARVPFTSSDLKLGKNLWEAYRLGDGAQLAALSKSESPCFRHLEEVCQAQLDRISADPSQRRPEKQILELLAKGITDFDTLFSQFSEREGIYGFGDLQVRELFDYLVSTKKTLT
jgi:hypothetical protein